jgi:lactate permease
MFLYQQVYDPIANSLGWSSLFAVLPLVVLFVLLGVVRVAAQWAVIAGLVTAFIVAVIVYDMPVGQAALSTSEGAAFGLFPIMWIVVNALWVYNMTVESGHFAALRRAVSLVSADQRVQAVMVAFSFGALLEALAGFGTPVAISAVLLIAMGFRPIKAASVALVANTAPVAFGALAIPIVTLGEVTGLSPDDLGAMVGRQTPFLALIVPLVLVFMVDGGRGLRQTWPVAIVGGAVFAAGQFLTSNYFSVELTDIVASLASMAAIVLMLRVWEPSSHEGVRTTAPVQGRTAAVGKAAMADAEDTRVPATTRGTIEALAPYAIIVAVFALAQWGPINEALDSVTRKPLWPGLHLTNGDGEAIDTSYKLNYFTAAGTLLLASGLLTMAALRINIATAVRVYGKTLYELRWAILTVATVLGLGFLMNYSGETITIGKWAAEAGGVFALLASLIGWLGVAVSGSDTSSNALFGSLQVAAAKDAGLSPTLMAAANSSGGVLGKMISPQNLAIGAAAVGMGGREGDIFRRVLVWSLMLVAVMCVLVYLQSTSVLSWMVP